MTIPVDGTDIKPTNKVRILRLLIQENGKAGAAIAKLKMISDQIIHMIRRVTNRQRGLKEEYVLRLVRAFVISRIVYSAPYLQILKNDFDQLDAIFRKATKVALGIPFHSSNKHLLGMAKHNTVRELIEAHLSTQQILISQTPAGRALLAQIGCQVAYYQDKKPIPTIWATIIESKPIPQNMNHYRNKGRRKAILNALEKLLEKMT